MRTKRFILSGGALIAIAILAFCAVMAQPVQHAQPAPANTVAPIDVQPVEGSVPHEDGFSPASVPSDPTPNATCQSCTSTQQCIDLKCGNGCLPIVCSGHCICE